MKKNLSLHKSKSGMAQRNSEAGETIRRIMRMWELSSVMVLIEIPEVEEIVIGYCG